MTITAPDLGQRRALDELEEIVDRARPQLVDAFDAAAFVESLGYTDERVQRELGLTDTRTLGEYLFERLGDRPLPVSPSMASPPASGAAVAGTRDVVVVVAIVLAWVGAAIATRFATRPWTAPLPLSLIASLVVWGGFLEAIRRRCGFYLGIGQPRIARVTCWYFVRLAALLSLVVAVGSVVAAVLARVAWPVVTLWADEFLLWSGLWAMVAALQIPGASSLRGDAANNRIAIPRMTVVAFQELRTIAAGSVAFLIACAPRLVSRGYAAEAAASMLLVAAIALVRRVSRLPVSLS